MGLIGGDRGGEMCAYMYCVSVVWVQLVFGCPLSTLSIMTAAGRLLVKDLTVKQMARSFFLLNVLIYLFI